MIKENFMSKKIEPFNAKVDVNMSDADFIKALKNDITCELQAIFLYDFQSNSINDPEYQKVLESMREEEKHHLYHLVTIFKDVNLNEAQKYLNEHQDINEILDGIKK
jgi:rubrerythrin